MPTLRSTAKRCGWRRVLTLLVGAVVGMMAAPAAAWNAAGHRLVADIAWREMEPAVRAKASALLRGHPDYGRWAATARKSELDRDVFAEASLWADRIRGDRRFYDADKEEATPTLEGFPDMERRRVWHFLNRPLDRDNATPLSGRLDRALAALARTLDRGHRASLLERRYALPWLIHLVGDAHQPLHASTRGRDHAAWRDEEGRGERLINPFSARRRNTSLHAFWDDLPGPSSLRGERLEAASAALVATSPRPPAATSEAWLDESWQIAREHAYPADGESVVSEAFYTTSREIAARRVSAAGFRLAALLNRLLGER